MADEENTTDDTGSETTDSGSSSSSAEQKPVLVHKLYRYHVEAFELLFSNLPNPLKLEPGSITSIGLEKDFDKNFYPLFRLSCAMSPRLKEYIMLNKNDVQFRIRLQCDITDTATGVAESSEDVFNMLFVPIIGEASPLYDSSLYDLTAEKVQELSESGATANDLRGDNLTGENRETVDYYLYLSKDLINSKAVINNVYGGNNLMSILVSLLSENGFDAILMSPSDNQGDFDQVIVPPMNLINVFKYFSETYGLHSTGTTAFFDYRCIYILNKSGHPNCVEEGEYPKTIYTVHESKNSESHLAGTLTCDKNKEYHIYPDPHRIKVSNFSVYNDHIGGNTLKLINSQNNSSATIGSEDGITRISNNNNANDYAKTEYANTVSENNKRMRVVMTDVYFWALTPNKEHLWNWMDPRLSAEYSGYYRPLSTNFWFAKNGDGLTLTVTAEYVKKEDLSEAEKAAIDEEVKPVNNPSSSSTSSNVENSDSSSETTSSGSDNKT